MPTRKKCSVTPVGTAAKGGDDARLGDEKAITSALQARGLAVDTIDLAPFRDNADSVYAKSDLAKQWDTATMQRAQKA